MSRSPSHATNATASNTTGKSADMSQNEQQKDGQKDKRTKGQRGRFPVSLYKRLPDTLRDPAMQINQGHDRDAFLTGALPVAAGCVPTARMKYGRWQSLNLYAAVIAPAGSGKGNMGDAKRLGHTVDERLHIRSEQALETWQRDNDQEAVEAGPRPKWEQFYIAGDNSARQLKEDIATTPHGVIFETEFKTFANVLSQDWGKARDVLLKGHPNETVKFNRKGDDRPTRIEHPAPSIAVSGTPGTFREVIGDTEDGLFSRFMFYQFEGDRTWKNQFGGIGESPLDRAIETAANRLDTLHEAMHGREEPLYVTFSSDAEDAINATFEALNDTWDANGVPGHLFPNLRRAALHAARIAGILSILRLAEEGRPVASARTVEVGINDAEVGTHLAIIYLRHAAEIASAFSAHERRDGLTEKQRRFLNTLPDGRFTTAEAEKVGVEVGGSERSARRWLKRFAKDGLVRNADHGEWFNAVADGESVPDGIIGISGVLDVLPDLFGDTAPAASGGPTSGEPTEESRADDPDAEEPDGAEETASRIPDAPPAESPAKQTWEPGDRVTTPKGDAEVQRMGTGPDGSARVHVKYDYGQTDKLKPSTIEDITAPF